MRISQLVDVALTVRTFGIEKVLSVKVFFGGSMCEE